MSDPIVTQVVEELADLPEHLQQQVLEFVRRLTASGRQGVPGKDLLRFAGAIPADDLERMRRAIEAGCEKVDTDGW